MLHVHDSIESHRKLLDTGKW